MNESNNELFDVPQPGEEWRHYKKGTVYLIRTIATCADTAVPVVVYEDVQNKVTYCRLLKDFLATVVLGKWYTPRFERLP